MENQQKERLFGCGHKDHQKSQLSHICIKKGCDNLSRVVCFKCMQQQSHPHYNNLLDISEVFEYEKGQFIENWPKNKNLGKISSFDKDAQIEEMEKQFDALGKNITKKILEAKKECKIKILEYVGKLEELKQRLDDAFNLEPLKQAVYDYQNQKISIKQFNKRISEFSDRDCLINSEKEILQKYKNLNQKEVDLEPLKIVENQIEHLFQNLPINIFKKKYQFTFQPLNGCEQYVQVDETEKSIVRRIKTEGYDNVRSIETFEGKVKIQFKFKFNKKPDSAFFLGFATENQSQQRNCFWFDSGIQLNISHNDSQNKGKFVVERGNISKYDLFQQKDVVYEVEICVEEKLFVIRNEKNNFEMRWQGEFQPELNQKWVLVVGGNNNGNALWEVQVM